MKGFLKKLSIVLKMSSIFAIPAAILALTVGATVGGIKMCTNAEADIKKAKQQILENPIVVELKESELEFYENQYKEGLLPASEYQTKKKYLESEDYIDSIIDLEGFEEEKAMLKSTKESSAKKMTWGAVLGVVGGTATFFSLAGTCAIFFSKEGSDAVRDVLSFAKSEIADIDKEEAEKKDTIEIKY